MICKCVDTVVGFWLWLNCQDSCMVFIVFRKMYPYYQSIFHVSSVACDRSSISQASAHHISLSTLISHTGIKDYHFLSQEVVHSPTVVRPWFVKISKDQLLKEARSLNLTSCLLVNMWKNMWSWLCYLGVYVGFVWMLWDLALLTAGTFFAYWIITLRAAVIVNNC